MLRLVAELSVFEWNRLLEMNRGCFDGKIGDCRDNRLANGIAVFLRLVRLEPDLSPDPSCLLQMVFELLLLFLKLRCFLFISKLGGVLEFVVDVSQSSLNSC
jgi:hypothetical protein